MKTSKTLIERIISNTKCTQDEKHLAAALEFSRWELSDAEKELKLLMSVASASEKDLDSKRSSQKKLEEELMNVNNQIAELNSETGETVVQQLEEEEEIRVCKNMIKCTVFSDRPKEVVILKCYHLFCNPCIQRNFELCQRMSCQRNSIWTDSMKHGHSSN
ncbi:putative transcription factor C2H2 family [Medicago truncatula]|nr:E3 ubiquitin-protein ligase BRE1-like 2 [Medicago truncatula]XP_024634150.1 E3 ubiquitin-protein ligase BRE1-like 2 [Medicago truncatula]XP_024634151.1 E3 ubiquitin-protein ligase BRE1-like 2 [Medicago truncatula]XP_039687315.1 E3 ubiquitin-protein ligase BRE1-like 2 [Medicago truncatula]RHN67458.1 putative transcription factor C2H2 family [Medicago truncatula]